MIVNSKSNLNYYNIAGAAQVAGAIGVGASAAVNQVTRDTEAFIGAPSSPTQSAVGNAGTVIDATGLSLDAENTGTILGVAAAGAFVDPNLANKASTGSVQSTLLPQAPPLPASVGVAGAVGVNDVTDTAQSYINDKAPIDLAEPDLQVMPWGTGSAVPTVGSNRAIIGTDNNGFLHIRVFDKGGQLATNTNEQKEADGQLHLLIFDAAGNLVTDTDETMLPAAQATALSSLKQQLAGLLPPHVLTSAEKRQVLALAATLVGPTYLAQGNLTLTSQNDTHILAVTGSVSLAALNLITIGLAGSVSQNALNATTESFVVGATVSDVGTAALDAERQGEVMAVTIAASGSVPSPLTTITLSASLSVDVAASVSVNTIGGSTLAYISNGAVQSTGAVSLTATDSSTINADGGGAAIALAINPKGAAGVSIAAGDSVAENNVTSTVAAYLDHAQVPGPGPIDIEATNSSTIDAVTVAGAAIFSQTQAVGLAFGGAGAGSGNYIHNTIQAYVSDSQGLQPQSLTLSAKDQSQIDAKAIAAAITAALTAGASGSSSAISMGGSATVNSVANTVAAFVDQSTIAAAGPVTVEATESSMISGLAVGAAFAVAAAGSPLGDGVAGAGAGAASSNTIANVVSANISHNSTVGQTGAAGITLKAVDTATISASADGGAVANDAALVGISLAVGSAVATNHITDQVLAYVDGSVVTSAGGLSVKATSQNSIDALVISLAFSGAANVIGIAPSGAGASADNTIQNTVEAAVKDGATVTASGAVQLSATDTSTVNASVAAAALSIGTIAVAAGLSVTINTIDNQVAAYVDGSTVQSTNDALTLTSTATGTVSATSVGIATALGIGAAAAGATADSTILNVVQAYANDATLSSFGATQITAGSTLTPSASVSALSIGAVGLGISVLVPSVSIGGSTLASVEGASTVTAASLDVHATSDNEANLPLGLSLAIGLIGGAGAGASATVSRVTQAFIGAETGGPSTVINVSGGQVSIDAASTSSATTKIAGGAFGALLDITAFINSATIGGSTRAFVGPAATVHASALDIHANATETAAADLTAIGVGLIGGTGANASANITSVTEAFAGTKTAPTAATPGVTLDVTNAMDIVAISNGSVEASAGGGSGGLVQVTALIANANDNGQTHAYIYAGQNNAVRAGSLNIEADGNLSASAQSTAVAIGDITGTGATAQATVGSSDATQTTVAAFIALAPETVPAPGTTTVHSAGAVVVKAYEAPHANAGTFGVGVGDVSVSGVNSSANVWGTASSYLGDGVTLSATSLTLDAERALDSTNDPTASSSTTAGVGGLLLGVNATDSQATNFGTVQAYTGSNVTLVGGAVTIEAANNSNQVANATGVTASLLFAIGKDVASASSGVNTSAQMGSGASTFLTGTLTVQANGTDENDATAIAGSGGLIAGHAAEGSTSDTSNVSAGLGAGNILASAVDVTATNYSRFVPNVSSVNAAIVGGSGAYANNTDTTSANVTIANNVNIVATFEVNIAALNSFGESVPTDGNNVAAGEGGIVNGSAAQSTTTLTGESTVTIGSSVSIDVETIATPAPGTSPGIFLTASSVLQTSDQVTLSAGGAIEGAGTNSSLSATLTNKVVTNSSVTGPDKFTTNQSIGIGTRSQVNASTTSEAHTWGVLGVVATSTATTAVTANEIVTLGPDTNLTAYQNINLTAGDDPTAAGNPSSMVGSSNGQSYARGFIGVPVASATTDLTSNASLNVGANDQIYSGANVTLAADPGTPIATAVGIGHGYELGFIPVTDGSSSPRTTPISTVTLDGTIKAGIFDQLDITIPSNAPTTPVFSEPDSPIAIASPFYSFNNSFSPVPLINNSNLSALDKQVLASSVSSSAVAAMTLGSLSSPLTANGGNVTVNAETLLGTATITAYGAPTINITNNSFDYLILGPIVIPDLAAGNVVYTGKATAAPNGMTVVQVNAGGSPVVNLQELYDQPVGNSNSGPAVFVTGAVNNLLGQVSIYNAFGSIIQLAAINANQVDLSAPNGALVVDIPNGTEVTGSSPYPAFTSSMIWPGGNPATTVNLSARDAVAFVANAMFNTNGVYGTDSTKATSNSNFTASLIGLAGQTPPSSFLNPDGSGNEPSAPQLSQGSGTSLGDLLRQAGTSLVFYGSNTGENTGLTEVEASSDSPVGQFYQMGDITDRGLFPVAPVEPLSVTANAYPSLPTPRTLTGTLTSGSTSVTGLSTTTGLVAVGETVTGTGIPHGATIQSLTATALTLSAPASISGSESLSFGSSAINAAKVIIKAKVIDLNSTVNVGLPNNWSVDLPSSLTSTIATDHAQGGSTLYDLPLSTVSSGDNQITAQYDAVNNQIIVNNVNASSGAGFLSLDGAIINTTNQSGNIQVNDGNGQVRIYNETGVSVKVNNVNAGSGSLNSTPPTEVDIIDTNQPSATQQTLYVYNPGGGIQTFQGTAQATMQTGLTLVADTQGTSTSYSPLSGLRYQWQLQANLTRHITVAPNPTDPNLPTYNATAWSFVTAPGESTANDPWYYLDANGEPTAVVGGSSTPFGQVVSGTANGPAFEETISGNVQDWFFAPYVYHGGHYGFAPTNPPVTNNVVGSLNYGEISDPWAYYYADLASLTLTDSVKADNPISISFSGQAQGFVGISSNAAVTLAGNIANPNGDTIIIAPSIAQNSTATVTSNNLKLTATSGGIGSSTQPFSASLTVGGVLNVQAGYQGVYVNLHSDPIIGQVASGDAQVGYGPVVIHAADSLEASNSSNIIGSDITLTSDTGEVGIMVVPPHCRSRRAERNRASSIQKASHPESAGSGTSA